MTQDEIIRTAQEAGLSYSQTLDELKTPFCDGVHIEELERFAQLVAAAEREACAKVCDKVFQLSNNLAASQCAWEVRKRDQK